MSFADCKLTIRTPLLLHFMWLEEFLEHPSRTLSFFEAASETFQEESPFLRPVMAGALEGVICVFVPSISVFPIYLSTCADSG